MRKAKAIITDLDKTLLKSDGSISKQTARVLKECHDRNIYIFAASARPLRDMLIYKDIVGFDAVAATNGAVISLPQGLVEIGIPIKSGENILEKLLRYPDAVLSVETSRGLYSNRDIPEWEPVVYDRFPALPAGIILYKILASSKHRDIYDGIEDYLTDDVYHTIANGNLIQIMANEATKWNGIVHMLTAFNVDFEDCVYFGDDNDDIEPIKRCGLGVAVSNAVPAVLNVADKICESNDLDGVARFIEENIL